MRGSTAEKEKHQMKNTEGTTTTESAAVAEQGAHVAPEKAPSKKDAKASKKSAKPQPQRRPALRAPRAKARKSWR